MGSFTKPNTRSRIHTFEYRPHHKKDTIRAYRCEELTELFFFRLLLRIRMILTLSFRYQNREEEEKKNSCYPVIDGQITSNFW